MPSYIEEINRKSLLTLSILFVCIPIRGVAQAGAAKTNGMSGPFGFDKGMTRAQVISLVGEGAVDTVHSRGDLVWLNNAPKPHPAFDSYLLFFSPGHGLVKVMGSGRTLDVEDDGLSLREAFDEIVKAVEQEYGEPEKTNDFCTGWVECDSEQFWMMGLLHKNRVLSASWSMEVSTVRQVKYISVQANALKLDKGYLTFACEFEGWSQYLSERKTAGNSSL